VATHPTLFSRLGGHSSTVPADNALLSMLGSWGGPVWLDVGDADNLRSSIEALARTLQADGVRAQVHVWPGTHNRAYWGAHVADYLRFYTAGWPSPRAGGS
jgi:acetyl esterase/lipase